MTALWQLGDRVGKLIYQHKYWQLSFSSDYTSSLTSIQHGLEHFMWILCRFFGLLLTAQCLFSRCMVFSRNKNYVTWGLTVVLFFNIQCQNRKSEKIYCKIPEVRILMRNQKCFCPMIHYALYRFAELE